MSKTNEIDTGVTLPEDGIITVEWARLQLERTSAFSTELISQGRGSVFFMLKTNLSTPAYELAVADLEYTTETAEKYIRYLELRTVLDAIKEKYYVAVSLSASELLPDNTQEALALCDIVVAKFGRITADNLKKALESTNSLPKKMSDSAISVEALKKKALYTWLLEEHQMSEDDILEASHLKPEGLKEFTAKMAQAYALLEDWQTVYTIISKPIHDADDMKALRFLADINDASGSIEEYLKAEKAFNNLNSLKETFNNEVYPELNFKEHKDN